jgi:L-ascorbate metabolism protein UlaG (beta-lactamase superfamily)
VTCVPAKHFSGRGLNDSDATLWCGYVLQGSAGNVYFAGDTGMGSHFAEIKHRLGPIRLALLPIGAYLPSWFMHPVHISPSEAVEVHDILEARVGVAIHFGTFALGDDGELEPVVKLREALASPRRMIASGYWSTAKDEMCPDQEADKTSRPRNATRQ